MSVFEARFPNGEFQPMTREDAENLQVGDVVQFSCYYYGITAVGLQSVLLIVLADDGSLAMRGMEQKSSLTKDDVYQHYKIQRPERLPKDLVKKNCNWFVFTDRSGDVHMSWVRNAIEGGWALSVGRKQVSSEALEYMLKIKPKSGADE